MLAVLPSHALPLVEFWYDCPGQIVRPFSLLSLIQRCHCQGHGEG